MYTRTLRLHPRRSCLLLGPRQVGKSTLVRASLPAKSWTVDLLEHDTFLRFAMEPGQFRREVEAKAAAGARTIFVDEIQRVPALLDEIHSLIEARGIRFLLTGSSARKLRRAGTNLLAGRAAIRRLHPLTMAELGDGFSLERVLRFGSLPAAASASASAARDLLRAYGQTYLREEIQAEALVRNIGAFGRFLDVVAGTCGDLVNFSAVGRDAAVATRTVQEYYSILEDTLVGFRLEAYRKSARARLVAHPKFYLFDTGVTNALAHRLDAPLDSERRGRLFEQWVVLECLRLLDYLDVEGRLFHWRTHAGAEVDLVVELHGELVLAVEIKSTRTVAGAQLTGMRSFQDAHPGVPCVVAAVVPEAHRIGEIEVLPYPQVFRRLAEAVRGRKP